MGVRRSEKYVSARFWDPGPPKRDTPIVPQCCMRCHKLFQLSFVFFGVDFSLIESQNGLEMGYLVPNITEPWVKNVFFQKCSKAAWGSPTAVELRPMNVPSVSFRIESRLV